MITNSRIVQLAINSAFESKMRTQHGAVIARNNKPLLTGYNSRRTRINRHNQPSCHAEIDILYMYLRRQDKVYGL